MKYVYGRKKWLAAGIAALLISGTGAVSDVLAAPVYASRHWFLKSEAVTKLP